jgi:hypothetical protein
VHAPIQNCVEFELGLSALAGPVNDNLRDWGSRIALCGFSRYCARANLNGATSLEASGLSHLASSSHWIGSTAFGSRAAVAIRAGRPPRHRLPKTAKEGVPMIADRETRSGRRLEAFLFGGIAIFARNQLNQVSINLLSLGRRYDECRWLDRARTNPQRCS